MVSHNIKHCFKERFLRKKIKHCSRVKKKKLFSSLKNIEFLFLYPCNNLMQAKIEPSTKLCAQYTQTNVFGIMLI